MAPAQKMALVRRAWVNCRWAAQAQARAEALASEVAELRAGNAPPRAVIDAIEAAAQAFDAATWAAQEADGAARAVRDAMTRDGLSDDASVADWLALLSEEDRVTD